MTVYMYSPEEHAELLDVLEDAIEECPKPVSTKCRNALATLKAMKPVEYLQPEVDGK